MPYLSLVWGISQSTLGHTSFLRQLKRHARDASVYFETAPTYILRALALSLADPLLIRSFLGCDARDSMQGRRPIGYLRLSEMHHCPDFRVPDVWTVVCKPCHTTAPPSITACICKNDGVTRLLVKLPARQYSQVPGTQPQGKGRRA